MTGFGFILDHKAQELGDAEGEGRNPKILPLIATQLNLVPLLAVFVHYTAIQSVQGGARAFKSLCEASAPRRALSRLLEPHSDLYEGEQRREKRFRTSSLKVRKVGKHKT